MEKKNLYAELSGWNWIEISGPDSKDFLQRLTSADFRFLKAPGFTSGLLLTATGKIVVYFKVLCVAPGSYLLALPSSMPNAMAEFEKMHFRENLKMRAVEGLAYFRAVGCETNALTAETNSGQDIEKQIHIFNENRWCVAPVTTDTGFFVPPEQVGGLVARLEAAGFARTEDLEGYRIRARDPKAPNEINTSANPLEIGLEHAAHENKGCYPGQEVIERIRSMGQAPRRLMLVRGGGNLPPAPEVVLVNGAEAGTLTSAAADPFDSGWIGLAVIKKAFAVVGTDVTVAGIAAQIE